MKVFFKKLPHAESIELPDYATRDSAGMDVRAVVDEPLTLKPGQRALVPTGFQMALPPGYEAQIRPRSGLALRHGITMLNTPGTIDADYRGEVSVLVVNLGQEPYEISRGDRIAQMVIAPVTRAEIVEAGELPETVRGEGGFGSTGSN
ncbi:dUTP diphosphatase [Natronogracilivirga saccharolytica]|uniref:Deoxyuridine 5'-triphosphate nucleotidohydrolase n=1 Tax=Natronogracilivirga saccharolytica TaxID=2812953 RepID=A0A8J7UTI8_9BACT|nr:dUTP diphosphatase [Natronogracilivirga saccharolytica]MBP3192651.1 dUTP diphosphatase [Natronogracilivirga saccharolytica]